MAVIDMQMMRYINLFDRVSNVKTTKCFLYNNTIIFAVPKPMLSRSIGPGASNIYRIQDQLGKRVKVIEESNDISDVEDFIKAIVAPVNFKSLEIVDRVIVLTAGSQSKAALLGRNKRRYEELKKIIHDVYGFEFKIV